MPFVMYDNAHDLEPPSLLAAAREGDLRTVTSLLEGLCPFLDDSMIAASARGHAGVVRLLLASPLCHPGAQNNLALQFAVMYAHPTVVAILLADSRVDPCDLVYLLGLAIGENHDILTLMEMTRQNSECDLSEYYFGEGSAGMRMEVVAMLISDKRVLLPSDGIVWVPLDRPENGGTWTPWREVYQGWSNTKETLLAWAAEQGSLELVRALLTDGRFSPQGALRVAARDGDVEMCRTLMADSRVEAMSAMSVAAGNGRLYVVSYFMALAQKPTRATLHDAVKEAASGGHADVVRFLLYDTLLYDEARVFGKPRITLAEDVVAYLNQINY